MRTTVLILVSTALLLLHSPGKTAEQQASPGTFILIRETTSDNVVIGFLMMDQENLYVYTAQSALYGVANVSLTTSDGKRLVPKGDMEIATDCDLVRIPVEKGVGVAFKAAPPNTLYYGIEVSFSSIGHNGTLIKNSGAVTGIGAEKIFLETWQEEAPPEEEAEQSPEDSEKPSQEEDPGDTPSSCETEEKSKSEAIDYTPGAPVTLEDGTVVGVVSATISKFDFALSMSEEQKISLALSCGVTASKLNSNTKWVSAKSVAFNKVSAPLRYLPKLQKNILPFLNWWFENPYRLVPGDIFVPPKLKPWVKDNNRSFAHIQDKVAAIAAAPHKHKNLIRTLREAVLSRGKRLAMLTSSVSASLDQKCKTWFLRSRLTIAKREWRRLLDMTNCRVKSLSYRIPGITPYGIDMRDPVDNESLLSIPTGPMNICKSLIAIQSKNGADHGLAILSSTSDGTRYAVTSTSLLSKKLYYFQLKSLYSGHEIKFSKIEISKNGDVMRIKLTDPGKELIPLSPSPSSDSDEDTPPCVYLMYRESGVARTFKMSPLDMAPMPLDISPGGPVFSSDGKLLGVASTMASPESESPCFLELSKFSMDEEWRSVSLQKVAAGVNAIKNIALDTLSLEVLEPIFTEETVIEIYPFYTQRHRVFIEGHDNLLLTTYTRDTTKKDHMFQFKMLCSCFTGLKSIRSWGHANIAALTLKKWKLPYFAKWTTVLRRRNEKIVNAVERRMATMRGNHPTIKDRLR